MLSVLLLQLPKLGCPRNLDINIHKTFSGQPILAEDGELAGASMAYKNEFPSVLNFALCKRLPKGEILHHSDSEMLLIQLYSFVKHFYIYTSNKINMIIRLRVSNSTFINKNHLGFNPRA